MPQPPKTVEQWLELPELVVPSITSPHETGLLVGSSGFDMGRRVEVETAAVEVDRELEVMLIPKAVGALLDGLDLRVEPLGDGVGHPVREVGEHIGQVALDRLRCVDH